MKWPEWLHRLIEKYDEWWDRRYHEKRGEYEFESLRMCIRCASKRARREKHHSLGGYVYTVQVCIECNHLKEDCEVEPVPKGYLEVAAEVQT
jgi:hypothetical protein